jgi:hypothetical protein
LQESEGIFSKQGGELGFAGAAITESFQARISEQSHHAVSSLIAMIVQPGIFAAELGAPADEIESHYAIDLDVLRQIFLPILLLPQSLSGCSAAD